MDRQTATVEAIERPQPASPCASLGCRLIYWSGAVDSKECTACGQVKPVGEFYKQRGTADGLRNWCKECMRGYQRAYVRNGPLGLPRRARKNRLPPDVVKERNAARTKAWRAAHPDRVAAWHGKHRGANEEQTRAGWKLRRCVVSGQIRKPAACSSCETTGSVEAHHEDYSRPLEVSWLCRKCHVALHQMRHVG